MIYECLTDASVSTSNNLTCAAFIVKGSKSLVYQSSRVYHCRCNNHGEIIAIQDCLLWLMTLSNDSLYHSKITIKTDSREAIESILHRKDGAGILTRKIYRDLLTRHVNSISIIHVNRSIVQPAHNLARKGLGEAIGPNPNKTSQIKEDKRIERAWILSQWLEKVEKIG